MISHICGAIFGFGHARTVCARIRRKPAHRWSFTFADK